MKNYILRKKKAFNEKNFFILFWKKWSEMDFNILKLTFFFLQFQEK